MWQQNLHPVVAQVKAEAETVSVSVSCQVIGLKKNVVVVVKVQQVADKDYGTHYPNSFDDFSLTFQR